MTSSPISGSTDGIQWTNCLICSRRCASTSSKDFVKLMCGNGIKSSSALPDKQQIEHGVCFVLKKLLQTTRVTCDKIIATFGSPIEWGASFCLQCSEVIEETQEISIKINHSLRQLKCLQQRIQEELRYSRYNIQDNDNELVEEPDAASIIRAIRKIIYESSCLELQGKEKDHQSKKNTSNNNDVEEEDSSELNLNYFESDIDEEFSYPTFKCSPKSVKSDTNEDNFNPSNNTFKEKPSYSKALNKSPSKKLAIRQMPKFFNKATEQNIFQNQTKKVSCSMCQKLFVTVNFLNLHYKKVHMGVNNAKDRSRHRALQKKKVQAEASIFNARWQIRKHLFKCPDLKCNQYFPSKHLKDDHHKKMHKGVEIRVQSQQFKKSYPKDDQLANLKECEQNTDDYKCLKCSSSFSSKEMRDFHGMKCRFGTKYTYECHICSSTFTRRIALKMHLKKVHRLVKIGIFDDSCKIDEQRAYESVDNDNTDVQIQMENEDTKNNIQQDNSSGSNDLATTGSSDEDYIPKLLPLPSNKNCKTGSKKLDKYTQRSSRKATGIFDCSYYGCGKKFHDEFSRDDHFMKIHQGVQKPFSCNEVDCTESFKTYVSLNVHKQTMHSTGAGDDSFICETCGKLYYNKIAFRHHIVHHLNKNNLHPCDECTKKFKSPAVLEKHKLFHRTQTDPQCDLCGMSFKTNLHLFNHRLAEHRIYAPTRPPMCPYKCEKCSKSFTCSASLKRHATVAHEQNFKFLCSICNKGYGDKSSYERHLRSHTGEKPYKCDICGKGLTRNSDLIRHKRLHTGEKPYVCDLCNEPFTDGSKLRKHMKTSHADATYPCHFCEKKFHTFTGLRLHMEIHNRESDEIESNSPKKGHARKPSERKKGKPRRENNVTDTTDVNSLQSTQSFGTPVNSVLIPGQSQQIMTSLVSSSMYSIPQQRSVENCRNNSELTDIPSNQISSHIQSHSRPLPVITHRLGYVDPFYLQREHRMNPSNQS